MPLHGCYALVTLLLTQAGPLRLRSSNIRDLKLQASSLAQATFGLVLCLGVRSRSLAFSNGSGFHVALRGHASLRLWPPAGINGLLVPILIDLVLVRSKSVRFFLSQTLFLLLSHSRKLPFAP
ncbi:hypothetical protein C8R47DRAFT_115351 [Mycena vitilis]|nr:hypothetical protein C8R47DRAFT_115351 [Mycena vitilis]